jgi:glycosyltransferase involved in cell wall biosynthesis
MHKNIFFSIVIASYNVKSELVSCIESIQQQNFSDYEVLISDGGSSDGTSEYIKSGAITKLTWYKSAPDFGIYDALNIALDHISGKWILILGADDRLADSCALNRAYQQITFHKLTKGIAYSNLFISRRTGISLKSFPEIDKFRRQYKGGAFIHHQSAFIARETLMQAGKFSLDYRIHSDYDLMLTVQEISDAVKINSAFVIFNADGFSSKLNSLWISFLEVYTIRRLHHLSPMPIRLLVLYFSLFVRRISPIALNL